MERAPEAEAYTELILTILRFWSSVSRHGREITKPFGETPARWQVLGGIWREPMTVAQIARRMGLARQSVQRVANALVVEDLAAFHPNPDHKRSPLLSLTERGHEIIEGIDKVQIGWSNRVAKGLELQDLDVTVRTIRKVTKILDAMEP